MFLFHILLIAPLRFVWSHVNKYIIVLDIECAINREEKGIQSPREIGMHTETAIES